MRNSVAIFLLTLLSSITTVAEAYVGPGLGMGTLGVIIGFVASLLIALFAILWYPLKRLLKTRKKSSISQKHPDQ